MRLRAFASYSNSNLRFSRFIGSWKKTRRIATPRKIPNAHRSSRLMRLCASMDRAETLEVKHVSELRKPAVHCPGRRRRRVSEGHTPCKAFQGRGSICKNPSRSSNIEIATFKADLPQVFPILRDLFAA